MQLFIAYISFLGCLILRTSAQVTPITAFPDYIAARSCVQDCVDDGLSYGYCGGAFGACLGCPQQSSLTCLCGTIGGVSASISFFIYSCASSSCGDVIEATSAANIFHEYCTAGAAYEAQATITSAASLSTSTGMSLTIPLPFIILSVRSLMVAAVYLGVTTVTQTIGSVTVTAPSLGYVTVTAYPSGGEPSIARCMMSSHLTDFYLTIGALIIILIIQIAGLRFRF